jgi:hypothetical protein
LHNALQQRKIKRDESVHEYLLVMKEIPKGKIEVEALIQYVINGIVDSPSNKAVLYGANNLADFKKKLQVYETMKTKNASHHTKAAPSETFSKTVGSKVRNNNRATEQETAPTSNERRCYNCNLSGHLAVNCPKPKRERGSCFKCGSLLHRVSNCPERNVQREGQAAASNQNQGRHQVKKTEQLSEIMLVEKKNLVPSSSNCEVPVTLIPRVHSSDLIAVVDTGGPISLIKDFFVPSLHCKPYQQTTSYTGINSSESRILGEFECKILLNNFETSILFHVVPPDTMTHNLVLGRNFLFTPDLQIIFDRERGIVVNKVEPEPIQESSVRPENELLLIDPHVLRDGIDHIL